MPDKNVSREDLAWLTQYLKYQAESLVSTDEGAKKAAGDLITALGGSPPKDNLQGWLESAPEALEIAAKDIVEQAEQAEAELTGKLDDASPEVPPRAELEPDTEEQEPDESEEYDDAELDELLVLYDQLLDLSGRLADGAELSADDMELLLSQADAEIITLSFEDESVSFEADGDMTLESSEIQQ